MSSASALCIETIAKLGKTGCLF
ncbi:protein of unknown function (plasmid) [Caballeronia sp. S22]